MREKIKPLILLILLRCSAGNVIANEMIGLESIPNSGLQVTNWVVSTSAAVTAASWPDGDARQDSEFSKKLESITKTEESLPGGAKRIFNLGPVPLAYSTEVDRSEGLGGRHIFASFKVVAHEPGTFFAVIGHREPVCVANNGEQITQLDKNDFFLAASAISSIQLRPGANIISIDLTLQSGPGLLSVRLFRDISEAQAFRNSCYVLASDVDLFSSKQNIELALKAYSSARLVRAFITDLSGREIQELELGHPNPTYKFSCHNLPDGIYKIKGILDSGPAVFSEKLCIGDPDIIYQNTSSALPPGRATENPSLTAIKRRWEILNREENRDAGDRQWKRKIAYTLFEYRKYIEEIGSSDKPLAGTAGLHMEGFISSIDKSQQFYRIYNPGLSKACPLIVIMPTTLSAERPFIESPAVANHAEAEFYSEIAGRYGVAVLWVGHRGQPWANPIDLAHTDEVLEHVRSYLAIDERRIYIYGTCSGGILSLAEIVKRPNFFAASCIRNGIFHRNATKFFENDRFSGNSKYRDWIEYADPAFEFLRQSNRTPVILLNDNNAEPGHGEVKLAQDFLREAGSHPVNIINSFKINIISKGAEFEQTLGIFLKYQREDFSMEKSNWPSSGNLSAGPISRAFSKPFILVEGTQGTEADKKAMKQISTRFQESWARSQFARCITLKDTDIDNETRAAFSLILIGNADTNVVWNDINGCACVSVSKSGIAIGKKTWNSPSSAIQAIINSPWSADQCIVLMGGSILANCRFGTLELEADGWYDYAIWETTRNFPHLVTAGHFLKDL